MRVCQTCGNIGFPQALVLCSKCRIITEHAYCLDKSEKTEEGEVIWTCEFCEPRIIDPSDNSGFTDNVSDDAEESKLTEEAQSIKDGCDVGQSTIELPLSYRDSENSNKPTEHMHAFVEDLHLPSEGSEMKITEVDHDSSPEALSSPKDEFCSTIKPLPDPIWMENFHIYGEYSCTIQGMMAHLSNETCKEATDVASTLPVLLRLEMVPKLNIWPMKFKIVEPSVDNIAVYFFPEDDRAERVYDSLVENVIDHEFAMISRINDVELLIFSSCELPIDDRRLHRKYYLWGIFRRKRRNLHRNRSDD